MNADQLMNAHRVFLEKEGNDFRLNDLLERINIPDEEVCLSPTDKIKLSYGLHFLELELRRNVNFSTD